MVTAPRSFLHVHIRCCEGLIYYSTNKTRTALVLKIETITKRRNIMGCPISSQIDLLQCFYGKNMFVCYYLLRLDHYRDCLGNSSTNILPFPNRLVPWSHLHAYICTKTGIALVRRRHRATFHRPCETGSENACIDNYRHGRVLTVVTLSHGRIFAGLA